MLRFDRQRQVWVDMLHEGKFSPVKPKLSLWHRFKKVIRRFFV